LAKHALKHRGTLICVNYSNKNGHGQCVQFQMLWICHFEITCNATFERSFLYI